MMKETQGCVNQATGHHTTGKQALCDASGLIAGPEFRDRGSQLATAAPITISQT
jgi:hypothetical protein